MKKETDPFEIIKKELSNYDTSVLVEFMDKFPPTTRTHFLPIYEIGKIKYVIFGSVDDFWKRWNRFKKLIAFL